MRNINLKTLNLITMGLFMSYMTQAQTRASSDNNTLTSATCMSCVVTNPENARDIYTSTFTTFDVTSLPAGVIGYLSRDYLFSSPLPTGDEITIDFQLSDNTLLSSLGTNVANSTIFDRLKVELFNGTTLISTYGGSGLLSNIPEVNVSNSSAGMFSVILKVPTNTVNKIRITSGALVSLGIGVVPSNLLVADIRSSATDYYYASRFTGNSGQMGSAFTFCANCAVTQESLVPAYSSDPNSSYASFKWDIGLTLLGSEYQYSEFDWGASANNDFLGNQDGIQDAVVVVLQESSIADVGLTDLGLNLWSSGGVELFVTYTDLTTQLYDNSSNLLKASTLGSNSGRFEMTFDIPLGKTVKSVEVRRVAPTVGLFTELRLFSIYSTPVTSSVLPLELGSFKACKVDNTAQLNWSTLQEKDIAYFEVERSHNAMDFETIGTIKTNPSNSNGNSYTYTDAYPLPSNNYYRLKLVDHNEAQTYSAITVLDFTRNVDNYLVYTNQNKLLVKNHNVTEGSIEITILSLDGKVLRHFTKKAANYPISIDSQNFGQTFVVKIKHQEEEFTRIISNL